MSKTRSISTVQESALSAHVDTLLVSQICLSFPLMHNPASEVSEPGSMRMGARKCNALRGGGAPYLVPSLVDRHPLHCDRAQPDRLHRTVLPEGGLDLLGGEARRQVAYENRPQLLGVVAAAAAGRSSGFCRRPLPCLLAAAFSSPAARRPCPCGLALVLSVVVSESGQAHSEKERRKVRGRGKGTMRGPEKGRQEGGREGGVNGREFYREYGWDCEL